MLLTSSGRSSQDYTDGVQKRTNSKRMKTEDEGSGLLPPLPRLEDVFYPSSRNGGVFLNSQVMSAGVSPVQEALHIPPTLL